VLAQAETQPPRILSATSGDLELRIPKLRAESLFPLRLEHQSRINQTLFAIVMERSRTPRVGAAICPRHPVWVWFSTDRPVEGQPVLASPSADALAGREPGAMEQDQVFRTCSARTTPGCLNRTGPGGGPRIAD
jgi:hypothetical protein